MMFPIVILAGGLATRLRPLTETIPKSLVEVSGVPFVAHQLRLLKSQGVEQVVMCLGYLGEMVVDYLQSESNFGLDISYSFDGPKLLGTAGALKLALPMVSKHFIILYGDSYLPCDYAAAQNAFIQSHKPALMTVFRNIGLWDKSNVEFENGEILVYDKKVQTDRMHYIDYGLGIFDKAAFDHISNGISYDLADLYQDLLAKKQLAALEIKERFYEVGSFSGIEDLQYYLDHNNIPSRDCQRVSQKSSVSSRT